MKSISRSHIKLAVVTLFTLGFAAVTFFSSEPPVSAGGDPTLEEIAGYRGWTKVTKEPILGAPLFTVRTDLSGG